MCLGISALYLNRHTYGHMENLDMFMYFARANQRRRQYYIHHTEQFLNELYYYHTNCTISAD